MSNKQIKELRNLSAQELVVRLKETESQLFKSKMQHRIGQLEKTSILWGMRKEVARIKTLMQGQGQAKGK